MGLAAVGHLRLSGVSLGRIYQTSVKIGHGVGKLRNIEKEVA